MKRFYFIFILSILFHCYKCNSLDAVMLGETPWKAKNPIHEKLIYDAHRAYKITIDEVLQKIIEGTPLEAFSAPDLVNAWYMDTLRGFDFIQGKTDENISKIIDNDFRGNLEFAKRRKFQIAYIALEKTEIKKDWTLLYQFNFGDMKLIVPAPDGFSIIINISDQDNKNITEFAPTNEIKETNSGWKSYHKTAYINIIKEQYPFEEFKKIKEKEIFGRNSKGWIDESDAHLIRKRATGKIFNLTENSICFGEMTTSKFKNLPVDHSSDTYSAICYANIRNNIFYAAVRVSDNPTPADATWANAVLISWRDAILAANRE